MIEQYKKNIEKELENYLNPKHYGLVKNFPNIIFESMAYTTLAGGKRLRAILCLETARLFGGDYKSTVPIACAIEMLHAQSLIHDDLPCMDNDDLRRGKPTNHKVYGEAIAVLSGDALISLGAQIILGTKLENKDLILSYYLKSAGVLGIVGGQTLDLISEGKQINFETLKLIHQYKTASMFECAICTGVLAGKATNTQFEKMKDFAQNLGLAFQIYDDIIDATHTTEELGKTAGKDAKTQKATYVTFFGVDEAKKKFNFIIKKCYDILKKVKIESEIFDIILKSMVENVK